MINNEGRSMNLLLKAGIATNGVFVALASLNYVLRAYYPDLFVYLASINAFMLLLYEFNPFEMNALVLLGPICVKIDAWALDHQAGYFMSRIYVPLCWILLALSIAGARYVRGGDRRKGVAMALAGFGGLFPLGVIGLVGVRLQLRTADTARNEASGSLTAGETLIGKKVFPMTYIKPIRSSFWLWVFFALSTVYYGYKGYWVDMPSTGGELMAQMGVLVITFILILLPRFGKIILQGRTLTIRDRFWTLSEKVTALEDIEHIAYRFPQAGTDAMESSYDDFMKSRPEDLERFNCVLSTRTGEQVLISGAKLKPAVFIELMSSLETAVQKRSGKQR